ncbi:DUF4625 domain-containing protein [Vaginella massiliensis]|uniref:DUF4625 domain-containing protein n=1 Tax=Vaginella massiliensis TaxID=1816680 RepID=UPI0008394BFE|nr:DUF4625 domain-containing protein [Vaginella massiliensis]
MKSNILKYSLVSLFAISAFSCSSDDDTLDQTKPTIVITTPKKDQHIHVGEMIEVDAVIADDRDLASYKIDIHYAGDGHTHDHLVAEKPWTYNYSQDVKGVLHNIKKTIEVPHGIQDGQYHFGIIAIDKAGNEKKTYIEIEIADHDHGHVK